jgi:hypothetical protein
MKKLKLLPIYAPKRTKLKSELEVINYNIAALNHNLDLKLFKILEIIIDRDKYADKVISKMFDEEDKKSRLRIR